MDDTLGLVDAAAAAVVESHRRDGALRWRCEVAKEAGHGGKGLEEMRNARAQQREVEVVDRDIVNKCNSRKFRRFVRALGQLVEHRSFPSVIAV